MIAPSFPADFPEITDYQKIVDLKISQSHIIAEKGYRIGE